MPVSKCELSVGLVRPSRRHESDWPACEGDASKLLRGGHSFKAGSVGTVKDHGQGLCVVMVHLLQVFESGRTAGKGMRSSHKLDSFQSAIYNQGK